MATITKMVLGDSSSSTLPIAITGDSSPGVCLHHTTGGENEFDEIWLWVHNNAADDALVTFELTDGDIISQKVVNIPGQAGSVLVMAGEVYNGALDLTAYTVSGHTSDIVVTGFVNRIAQ